MPRPDFPSTVLEFQRLFSSEDACMKYMIASRWPNGFECPRCSWREYYWKSDRQLLQCKRCGYQVSVTAGTVMHRSKMPLRDALEVRHALNALKKKLRETAPDLSRWIGCMKDLKVPSHVDVTDWHQLEDWLMSEGD